MLRLLLLALLGASLLVVGRDLQRDHSFRVLKGRLLISNLLRSHGREALWSMRPETRDEPHRRGVRDVAIAHEVPPRAAD